MEEVKHDDGHLVVHAERERRGIHDLELPLQRFSVARGEVRELSGVRDFRVCVGTDATTLGPDCQPAQPAAPAAP